MPPRSRDPREVDDAEDARRHLAAIVESSDDGIIGKNLDSVITSWNRAAERIFGYKAEEIIGRPITVLIPPELHDEEPRIIGRIRQGERIEHFETTRVHRDGHRIEISLTVSPIRDADGRIVGASKIVRDITQRKAEERLLAETRAELEASKRDLERRVLERTASLEQAISQLEEFSYTISHDLRAPLRGMQVYSQALLEDFGDTLTEIPDAARYLERIAANAARLDRMILDVLTFTRLARAEMAMEVVDLEALVRDLVSHFPSLNPPMAIVEVLPLHAVFGYEPLITQALSNLLTNAVKFVRPGAVPHVRVWSERHEGMVRVSIHDNGIGIELRFQDRLFRMFERIHPTDGREGDGVGLAIVKKAVERMKGRCGVESDGLHGTTFWIELPEAPR